MSNVRVTHVHWQATLFEGLQQLVRSGAQAKALPVPCLRSCFYKGISDGMHHELF